MSIAIVVLTGSVALSLAPADASILLCTDANNPNHTYTVEGENGLYTWDDHGIQRSRELRCFTQGDGSTACHYWGQESENGRSVIIYQMLPGGTLVEAGVWAILDVSRVVTKPGFACRD